MISPTNVEGSAASTDDAARGADRGLRLLPLVGACLACCVPMLLVLGVVSVGAALAGAVGLALFVALVVAAVMLAPRFRRR